MVVVTVAGSQGERSVDRPSVVRERLAAFGVEVLAEAMNRPVQVRNGGLYLRGLIEQGLGSRSSRRLNRLGGDADYQSLQQLRGGYPVGSGVGGAVGRGAGGGGDRCAGVGAG